MKRKYSGSESDVVGFLWILCLVAFVSVQIGFGRLNFIQFRKLAGCEIFAIYICTSCVGIMQ
jgi:hypothetical protein